MRVLQLIVQSKINITPNTWPTLIETTRKGLEAANVAFNPSDEWFGLKFGKPYELDTIADVMKERNIDMVVLTTYVDERPQIDFNLRQSFIKAGIKVTNVSLETNGQPRFALIPINDMFQRYWFNEHKYFIGTLVVTQSPEAHNALYVKLKRPIPPLSDGDGMRYDQKVDINQHDITDIHGHPVVLTGPVELHIKGRLNVEGNFKIEPAFSECGEYALSHYSFRDIIAEPLTPLTEEEHLHELSEMLKRNPPPHLIGK